MINYEDLLVEAGFSQKAIEEVKAGKLHYGGSLNPASDKELSVKLAFHVNAKLENVAELFMRFPKKKEFDDAVVGLGMIAEDGGEGSLADFAGVNLEPNGSTMDKIYLDAKAGSDLNLSKEEIEEFNKLGKQASHDDVEHCLRRVLLARFRSYKKNGLGGILPYARGKVEFSVGEEMKHQLEVGPILKKRSPVFWKYALEYPNNKPNGTIESFFWVNSLIDDKPTIALVHRLGMPQDGGYVYMERHFYISRSHNCLQGIGAAMPSEDGTAVFYATRTSTDQVAGFGGSAKRTIGNKIMGGRMAENFERARVVVASAKEIDMLNGLDKISLENRPSMADD